MPKLTPPVHLLSILLFLSSTVALVVVEVSTKLPTPRYGVSSIYDGNDAIYLIGGNYHGKPTPLKDIVRYTISTEEVQVMADLPLGMQFGSSSLDERTGDIYFHHGLTTNATTSYGIYKYSPTTNKVNLVANLTTWNWHCAVIPSYTNPMETYLLGGWINTADIVVFNMEDLTDRKVGLLSRLYYYSGAVADGAGSAILFGSINQMDDSHPPGRLNLTSHTTTYGDVPLPKITGTPSAVWDGSHAYLVAGYRNTPAGNEAHSIIQVDPNTLNYTLLPVANYPANGTAHFMDTSAVFVKKLSRIYFFGGYTSRVGGADHYNKIWYIELSPPEVTTPTTPTSSMLFTCENKIDGMHPHPTDCAKFINCNDDLMTVLDCPERLVFDITTRRCVLPDLVDCQLYYDGRKK